MKCCATPIRHCEDHHEIPSKNHARRRDGSVVVRLPRVGCRPASWLCRATSPRPMAAAIPGAQHSGDGSIYQASQGYSGLVTGTRARLLGDMVTIVLVESTSTSKSTSGETDRDGSFSLTPPTTGPLGFLNPNALNASGQGVVFRIRDWPRSRAS